MTPRLTLYSRPDCCLCVEMKEVIGEVRKNTCFELDEINVDSAAELREKFGDEVPVLFINGRKAFKYRLTARELAKRLRKADRADRGWLTWRS